MDIYSDISVGYLIGNYYISQVLEERLSGPKISAGQKLA
jgi:hypothetical protein